MSEGGGGGICPKGVYVRGDCKCYEDIVWMLVPTISSSSSSCPTAWKEAFVNFLFHPMVLLFTICKNWKKSFLEHLPCSGPTVIATRKIIHEVRLHS